MRPFALPAGTSARACASWRTPRRPPSTCCCSPPFDVLLGDTLRTGSEVLVGNADRQPESRVETEGLPRLLLVNLGGHRGATLTRRASPTFARTAGSRAPRHPRRLRPSGRGRSSRSSSTSSPCGTRAARPLCQVTVRRPGNLGAIEGEQGLSLAGVEGERAGRRPRPPRFSRFESSIFNLVDAPDGLAGGCRVRRRCSSMPRPSTGSSRSSPPWLQGLHSRLHEPVSRLPPGAGRRKRGCSSPGTPRRRRGRRTPSAGAGSGPWPPTAPVPGGNAGRASQRQLRRAGRTGFAHRTRTPRRGCSRPSVRVGLCLERFARPGGRPSSVS
jgi:hypothetical protein